jgi:hypothetical protein
MKLPGSEMLEKPTPPNWCEGNVSAKGDLRVPTFEWSAYDVVMDCNSRGAI